MKINHAGYLGKFRVSWLKSMSKYLDRRIKYVGVKKTFISK